MVARDARFYEAVAEMKGWCVGTSFEDKVAVWLSHYGLNPEIVKQQFPVGKYRLDFAVPEIKVAIEVDGPRHRAPDVAAQDVRRDSWLRSQGWLVFRVDSRFGGPPECEQQVARVVRVIQQELVNYRRGEYGQINLYQGGVPT